MTATGRTIVISQSMYFPWCGILDQIRHADVFVHYDDVQFARGFLNRVQVKTRLGRSWITVPIQQKHQGQLIEESLISYEAQWVEKHRAVLSNSYQDCCFFEDALNLFDQVHNETYQNLGTLCRATVRVVARYLELDVSTQFVNSSDLKSEGSSSKRLLDITRELDGTVYLTGHGASNYLGHELFEDAGIEVRYMNYQFNEYSQVYGAFTPYVTCLDAIAHQGKNTVKLLNSTTENWRNFNG
jgi:hypothetical protein